MKEIPQQPQAAVVTADHFRRAKSEKPISKLFIPHVSEVLNRVEIAAGDQHKRLWVVKLVALVHEAPLERVATLVRQVRLDQVTALVHAIMTNFGEIWRCATTSEVDAYVARHRNYLEELLLFEVAHEGRATATMRIVAGLAGLEETLEQWEIRLQQAYNRA